ncbi:MAG: hypothetical protein ACR2G4_13480 [Pyrinomonadaceae bacterium]
MKKLFPHLTHANVPMPLALVIMALLLLLLLLLLAQPLAALTQRREHLTPQEVEMVADAQELDKRSALLVKIAERRLLAITNPPAAQTQPAKEESTWGELPKGTRAAYFSDLTRILDEAINNVDDVATRTPGSKLLPKAIRTLAEASTRFLSRLTPLRESATADGEREALEQAIDNLQQIIDAAGKLPAEEGTEKKGKKKSEKKGH